MKIINICGARPNFMKIAPLMRAYRRYPAIEAMIVHTGQHYDDRLSDLFFRELEIPKPDINLEVGSGSHAVQTAEIMKRFEPVALEQQPDWVVVVGDVNSTIACALVAKKLGIRVAHVEAGLRSFDRTMPEEINRLLTDAISDLLFVSEPSGIENLRREGVDGDKVHFVGNVMIDTLRSNLEKADRSSILSDLGLEPGRYNVVTLHRPSNVDNAESLGRIADALEVIQQDLPTVFPMHPRTRNNLQKLGLAERFAGMKQLRIVEPAGYLDFLKLMGRAAVVLTDSGGIQEETTILGVWCLTLRDNTERPATITNGTNRLVGNNPAKVIAAYKECRKAPPSKTMVPEKWDGHAAERVAEVMVGGLEKSAGCAGCSCHGSGGAVRR
ncbi:MAG TPA: UDP-N-acetylglucosamine 2-epimerase (non-hydrolyzing) [Phycisphaerae bacterium]|nr:UDP-N-acetylglucosamine 2-epimerase (non-hydrolyzing) [Phycisphaerae bacterium]